MSYYKILGLEREPFSTTPDPDFFYQSTEHKSALYRLRVAIELRRGLSVILGDVGVGKTTLSRKLVQLLKAESNTLMSVVLNPIYESEEQFLADMIERFHIDTGAQGGRALRNLDYMNTIEHFLFTKNVEESKAIVLLIDESQKLISPCLEVLRTLLNYETNEYKILQVVLMGQMELLPRISGIRNLWDRIALKYVINPLGQDEVKELIQFRLKTAGYVSKYPLFSDSAFTAIYNYTQGSPRKIAMICHDALEYLVMHNKEIVNEDVVRELIKMDVKPASRLLNPESYSLNPEP